MSLSILLILCLLFMYLMRFEGLKLLIVRHLKFIAEAVTDCKDIVRKNRFPIGTGTNVFLQQSRGNGKNGRFVFSRVRHSLL